MLSTKHIQDGTKEFSKFGLVFLNYRPSWKIRPQGVNAHCLCQWTEFLFQTLNETFPI